MKPTFINLNFSFFLALAITFGVYQTGAAQLALNQSKRTPKTGKANINLFGFNVLKADSTVEQPVTLTINGYLDVYYGFNLAQPESKDNPYFYSSQRHNEFNVNLAYISIGVTHDRFRARFTPGWGTYMAANYSAEPPMMRNIYEASVGARLAKGLWLDAGVLPSPYGYEGAISKDQLTYTRSFSAENSPYYVTGAKLTKKLGEKVTLAAFAINGWQKIQQPMRSPSFGTQLQAKPNGKLLINWTTYFGDETTVKGQDASWRVFSDQYVQFNPGDKINLLALFDIGAQNKADSTGAKSWNVWYTANVIAKYKPTAKLGIALRGEYYSDVNSVIVTPITASLGVTGFCVYGGSLNVDYSPISNVLIRLEGRTLHSDRDVFLDKNGEKTPLNVMFTASISTAF